MKDLPKATCRSDFEVTTNTHSPWLCNCIFGHLVTSSPLWPFAVSTVTCFLTFFDSDWYLRPVSGKNTHWVRWIGLKTTAFNWQPLQNNVIKSGPVMWWPAEWLQWFRTIISGSIMVLGWGLPVHFLKSSALEQCFSVLAILRYVDLALRISMALMLAGELWELKSELKHLNIAKVENYCIKI